MAEFHSAAIRTFDRFRGPLCIRGSQVDRFDPALLQWLQGRDRQNLFVYAWAPGQIAQHLDGTHVDIRPVRDTLVKRFQQ